MAVNTKILPLLDATDAELQVATWHLASTYPTSVTREILEACNKKAFTPQDREMLLNFIAEMGDFWYIQVGAIRLNNLPFKFPTYIRVRKNLT